MAGLPSRSVFWLRVLMPACVGAALCAMIVLAGQLSASTVTPLAALIMIGLVYAISELCLQVGEVLERRWQGRQAVGWRIVAQLAAASLAAALLVLVVYVPIKLSLIAGGENDRIGFLHVAVVAGSAASIATLLALAHASWRYLQRWNEAERIAVQARHDALQTQVNPHFLFNSLNAIYGCIEEDPDRAQGMVLRLSEIFRHALRHGQDALVGLDQELALVQAYVALLNLRHEGSIELSLHLDAAPQRLRVPPMSVQVLVENAVKHTVFDHARPLRIDIVQQGDGLQVRNRWSPRPGLASGAGIGLENLRKRVALHDRRPLHIERTATTFTVTLPLQVAP